MDINEKYIKTDDNKLINEKCIRWIEKIEDCLEVCTKSNGCYFKYERKKYYTDTHKICKINNLDSYNRLNKHFE